jgi:hypothetical protein
MTLIPGFRGFAGIAEYTDDRGLVPALIAIVIGWRSPARGALELDTAAVAAENISGANP